MGEGEPCTKSKYFKKWRWGGGTGGMTNVLAKWFGH